MQNTDAPAFISETWEFCPASYRAVQRGAIYGHYGAIWNVCSPAKHYTEPLLPGFADVYTILRCWIQQFPFNKMLTK